MLLHIVTYRCGQDDVGVLNLKEVIDLCVTSQLLAGQPQRTKLLFPALKALTAESFDRGHWWKQTMDSLYESFISQKSSPQKLLE